MKEIRYIVFIIIILIGGAIIFRYWALNNINLALSDIDKNDVFEVYIPKKVVLEAIVEPENKGFSSSPTTEKVLTSSEVRKEESVRVVNIDSKKLDISFISPKKDENLYIGCKYQISFYSSSAVNSIGMSLNDFGTRKAQGPIASGIAKEITGIDIKSIEWKIGNVWPGKYFISTLVVNGQDLSKKSSGFNINKIPEDIKKINIEEFCKNNPSV